MAHLRAALVGYGFIAEKGHVAGYLARAKEQQDVSVVAVADICPARREAARQALPDARIYADYASLLVAEAGRIDYVDIATPPHLHAEVAHAALAQGLHVLCEKPLTTTVEQARALLAHAERQKRVLFPCHNYKHAPIVKAVKEVIRSGVLGAVKLVTLSTFRATHARGVAEWNPDWRRQARYSGGGIAMDHGSHTFYLAFDWLEAYPIAVTAKAFCLDGADTEDNLSCSLTFPHATVTAHLTWTAGVRKVMYSVHGEKGAVTVDDDTIRVSLKNEQGGWTTEQRDVSSDWMDASHVTWFGSLFDQFRQAIEQGEWAGKEAQDALRCVELITTAYASSADGCRELPLGETLAALPRMVPLAPVLGRDDRSRQHSGVVA